MSTSGFALKRRSSEVGDDGDGHGEDGGDDGGEPTAALNTPSNQSVSYNLSIYHVPRSLTQSVRGSYRAGGLIVLVVSAAAATSYTRARARWKE